MSHAERSSQPRIIRGTVRTGPSCPDRSIRVEARVVESGPQDPPIGGCKAQRMEPHGELWLYAIDVPFADLCYDVTAICEASGAHETHRVCFEHGEQEKVVDFDLTRICRRCGYLSPRDTKPRFEKPTDAPNHAEQPLDEPRPQHPLSSSRQAQKVLDSGQMSSIEDRCPRGIAPLKPDHPRIFRTPCGNPPSS